MKKLLFFAAICTICTSCATIIGGTKHRTLSITGEPPNAQVFLNNNLAGNAPIKLTIPANATGNNQIEIKKDGYTSQVINPKRGIRAGWLIADIFLVGWPLIIDFATGEIYNYQPQQINYSLQK